MYSITAGVRCQGCIDLGAVIFMHELYWCVKAQLWRKILLSFASQRLMHVIETLQSRNVIISIYIPFLKNDFLCAMGKLEQNDFLGV